MKTPGERSGAREVHRTLVASILFVDIVGYSKLAVGEQVRLKETLNAVLGAALEHVDAGERVVVDTGDGAGIAFLGDPEQALYAALAIFDSAGEVPVRMGINLGPVTLMKDINGAANVVGDGMNVAQRIMAFATQGELLASRSFYEVISLLSLDYGAMFRHEGTRSDKHDRMHDVYAVSDAVRVGRRVAEQARLRLHAQRRSRPPPTGNGPAHVSDAGSHFIVSGETQIAVMEAIERLTGAGGRVLAPLSKVGQRWIASVENPRLAVEAAVEEFGFKRVISAPTREAVEVKVRELMEFGATLVEEIEFSDGVWTAVCEKP